MAGDDVGGFRKWYESTIDQLSSTYHAMERHWTEALAVGDHAWLSGINKTLGLKRKRILPASPSMPGESPKSIHDGRAVYYPVAIPTPRAPPCLDIGRSLGEPPRWLAAQTCWVRSCRLAELRMAAAAYAGFSCWHFHFLFDHSEKLGGSHNQNTPILRKVEQVSIPGNDEFRF